MGNVAANKGGPAIGYRMRVFGIPDELPPWRVGGHFALYIYHAAVRVLRNETPVNAGIHIGPRPCRSPQRSSTRNPLDATRPQRTR